MSYSQPRLATTTIRYTVKNMSDQDVMIAVDFTLYENPLDRALRDGVRNSAPPQSLATSTEKEEDTWIAADMTKYYCPLSALGKTGMTTTNKDKKSARRRSCSIGQPQTKVKTQPQMQTQVQQKSDTGPSVVRH